jgi:hypothetical protein
MRTAEVEIGARIDGRYRVIRQLGAGGMSRVFLARDEQLERDVALKVFPPTVADDSEEARRRRDEVTLLAGLNHPGLVVLFDAALDGEPAYLTMEHVVGETLAERVHRGPLPPEQATALVMAIAEALAFVHARGIMHRDIKPGNILLPTTTTGTGAPAKLADFGIARLVNGSRLTATGSVMGTPAYISPEQASGLPASPASDIYALGIVLIECLTGTHPFPGTALESASARLSQQPDLGDPRLAEHRELLSRMTAADPADRPSAADVVADLSGAATTRLMAPMDAATVPLSTAVVVEPSSRPAAPPRVRRAPSRRIPGRIWIAVVAALLGAAVLVLATIVGLNLLTPSLDGQQGGPQQGSVDPAVTYPAVDGDLGIHLSQLQDAVAGTGLEDSVLATTVAAADGDYESASRLLDAVKALAAHAVESGELDADRARLIDEAIADVRADLKELLKPSDSPGNGNGHGDGGGKKD